MIVLEAGQREGAIQDTQERNHLDLSYTGSDLKNS